MSRKSIKFASVMLAICITMTLFAGCGNTEQNADNSSTGSSTTASSQAAGGESQADPYGKKLEEYTEDMKLSPYYGIGTASPTDPVNNATVKYIRDKFKIDLSGSIFISGENPVDKISMMIASNDMPEVVCMGVDTTMKELVNKFADAGMIIETSDYIQKFMPNLNKHFTDTILNSYVNAKDDKLYCIPGGTVNTDLKDFKYTVEANLDLAIRTDLLAKVGKSVPTNPDELYGVLKAFKDLPAVNGNKMIPYQPLSEGGDIQTHIGAMFGIWTHRGAVNESEQRMTVMQEFPDYLQYLKYAAKLFREGLIDPETYKTTYQIVYERVKQGRVGLYGIWPNDIINNNAAMKVNFPDAEYEPIKLPRVAGLENTQFWPVSTYGWMMTIVSKKVKDPERVIKLIDWMASPEGWATMCWGAPSKEDGAFYIENGKLIHNTEFVQKKAAEDPTYIGKNRGGWVYFLTALLQYLPTQICDVAGDVNPLRTKAAELNKDDLYINPEQEAIDQLPMGPVKKEKFPVVTTLLKEKEAKLIMTAKDDAQVETMYNDMMKEAVKAGLYDYLKEDYQAVQALKAKK